MVWLPEMARRKPKHLIAVHYEVPDATSPAPSDIQILEALKAASLEASPSEHNVWEMTLALQTRVYGFVPREVDERLALYVAQQELVLECQPIETHAAHSAGLAGIFLIALTAWITGGLGRGPAGALAIVAAGSLIVEVTRHWSLDALEKGLHRTAIDIGSRLWPGQPAQVQLRFRPISEETAR
jgi:hypothetical protein